jgi:hypothetical protein
MYRLPIEVWAEEGEVPWIGTDRGLLFPLGWIGYGPFLERTGQIEPNTGLLVVVEGICVVVA